VWVVCLVSSPLYADLPELRTRGVRSQLDIAGVFALLGKKSELPVLLCKISEAQEAWTVPTSALHMREVRSVHRETAAIEQVFEGLAIRKG
jgi:hypothetical protein